MIDSEPGVEQPTLWPTWCLLRWLGLRDRSCWPSSWHSPCLHHHCTIVCWLPLQQLSAAFRPRLLPVPSPLFSPGAVPAADGEAAPPAAGSSKASAVARGRRRSHCPPPPPLAAARCGSDHPRGDMEDAQSHRCTICLTAPPEQPATVLGCSCGHEYWSVPLRCARLCSSVLDAALQLAAAPRYTAPLNTLHPPCPRSLECLRQWCRTRLQPKCAICQAPIARIVSGGVEQVGRVPRAGGAAACSLTMWRHGRGRPLCSAAACVQDAPPPDKLEEEGPDLGCLDHAYFVSESTRLMCR